MRSMNRQRHEMNNVPISSEEYGSLEYKFDILRNEVIICRRSDFTTLFPQIHRHLTHGQCTFNDRFICHSLLANAFSSCTRLSLPLKYASAQNVVRFI